jgi:hypothetical protein
VKPTCQDNSTDAFDPDQTCGSLPRDTLPLEQMTQSSGVSALSELPVNPENLVLAESSEPSLRLRSRRAEGRSWIGWVTGTGTGVVKIPPSVFNTTHRL